MKKIITIIYTLALFLISINPVLAQALPADTSSSDTDNSINLSPTLDESLIPFNTSVVPDGSYPDSVTNTENDSVGGSVTNTGAGVSKTVGGLTTLKNPLRVDSIQDIIFLVVDIAIYIGVSFAVLAIIFVGFKFVMAQGKPEEIKKAREWMLWIIIGLAVLISSKVIASIVQNTLVSSGVVEPGVFSPK
jgi:hypothetical protein